MYTRAVSAVPGFRDLGCTDHIYADNRTVKIRVNGYTRVHGYFCTYNPVEKILSDMVSQGDWQFTAALVLCGSAGIFMNLLKANAIFKTRWRRKWGAAAESN
jgi:hypothetical protein